MEPLERFYTHSLFAPTGQKGCLRRWGWRDEKGSLINHHNFAHDHKCRALTDVDNLRDLRMFFSRIHKRCKLK